MIKLNALFTISALTILIAAMPGCGNDHPTKEKPSAEKKDSVVIDPLQKAIALFKEGSLPFMADTALMFRLRKFDSLGTNEMKAITKKWLSPDSVSSREYDMKEFFKIDSIKTASHYNAWCETLDVGMTKCANAYAINKIKLDENSWALVWALSTSSYEACPYSTRYAIYITTLYKGSLGETLLLGEYISAGDPPVAMERIMNGKINPDGKINIDFYEMNDEDMDSLPDVEITKARSTYEIKGGLLKILSEKKDNPFKQKRKKANS